MQSSPGNSSASLVTEPNKLQDGRKWDGGEQTETGNKKQPNDNNTNKETKADERTKDQRKLRRDTKQIEESATELASCVRCRNWTNNSTIAGESFFSRACTTGLVYQNARSDQFHNGWETVDGAFTLPLYNYFSFFFISGLFS